MIPELFHYTSQRGLIGILRDRVLWASKIQYLNDAAELSYAVDLLQRRLSPLITNLKEKETRFFRSLWSNLLDVQTQNTFVASFSEKGDLLSQWRAYCPENGGFSVGFTYEQLKPHLERQGFTLAKCVYKKSEQIALIDEYIGKMQENIRRERSESARDLAKQFLNIATIIKHPSFQEEQEWRIVSRIGESYSDSQVDYREGKSMIVPYFKFKLESEDESFSLERIYVGPTSHPELAVNSVRGLLIKYISALPEDVDLLLKYFKCVEESVIPYRTW